MLTHPPGFDTRILYSVQYYERRRAPDSEPRPRLLGFVDDATSFLHPDLSFDFFPPGLCLGPLSVTVR
jgi:hypothetical protein